MGKPSERNSYKGTSEPQTLMHTVILTSVITAFLILFPWLLKGFRGFQAMTYRAIL